MQPESRICGSTLTASNTRKHTLASAIRGMSDTPKKGKEVALAPWHLAPSRFCRSCSEIVWKLPTDPWQCLLSSAFAYWQKTWALHTDCSYLWWLSCNCSTFKSLLQCKHFLTIINLLLKPFNLCLSLHFFTTIKEQQKCHRDWSLTSWLSILTAYSITVFEKEK